MIVNFGLGALFITFLVSIFGIIAAIYGALKNSDPWIESARKAMLLTFPLLTISVLCITILLANYNFEVSYVNSVSSRSMPLYLRVTALWGGQAGSLVFWSWLMAAFASAVTLRDWKRDREFLPWVIVVSLVTLSFFLILALFVDNAFERFWELGSGEIVSQVFQPAGARQFTPNDGRGLNPLLRHPGMIIHPPMLYLGFVSFVIPFAFAIASLVTGRVDDRWIRITRRWTLWAWLFLSLGLLLGGRWAYDVLGWGGYWGWDPVEIASLMPWLTGTAFLHLVMIQERRGMLKQWNMVMIILTYDLVIFGTFLTRSGVLSSVHAFAESAIGPLFFSFIAITFAGSLALLNHRWKDLKSENTMTSMLSRESLILVSGLIFMGILVVCFWGVIFPLLTEALGFIGTTFPDLSHIFSGQKVTVGPTFYERATGPLWLVILFIMGLCPLAAWGISTTKTLGRAIWKPTLVSLIVPLVLILNGMRNPGAVLSFWLGAFTGAIIIQQLWRGARARSKRTGEILPAAFWAQLKRNQRRYGGAIIHLGAIFMSLGIIGIEMFQTETQGTIPQGGQITLGNYILTYDSLADFNTNDGRNVSRAVVSVYKDGGYVGELYPRRDYYFDSQQPVTIPGVRSTLEDDFYVLLVDWQPISTRNATFKVYHNPLVNWLWIGAIVFVIGTLVSAWSGRSSEVVRRQPKGSPARRVGT
jgi:cytochrome c-type biogenesis protein CcmF